MYDVVVIGAGPGGGSAALHAARAGLSTLILEADPEIGTPVHCGECLSELAVQNLDLALPDHVKALDVKGIRVIFPDGTEKLLTEEGYVLEKHLFERWLADEAVAKGAELLLHHRVTGMERISNSENQFSNWVLTGRGDAFPLECKAVIDASGVSGAAAKLLDMGGDVEVIAGFQYEMLDVPNDGYLDFYLWPKYSPHGYVWMIPKEGGGRMSAWSQPTKRAPSSTSIPSLKTPTLWTNPPSTRHGEQRASRFDHLVEPFLFPAREPPPLTTVFFSWATLQALLLHCLKAVHIWPCGREERLRKRLQQPSRTTTSRRLN